MTPLQRKLVRRLVFEPHTLSRNRNFHAFEHEDAREARKVAARLRTIRTSLRRDTNEVTLSYDGDGNAVVRVIDAERALRRTSTLTADELDVLCLDPRCAARLGLPVPTAVEPDSPSDDLP